MKKLVQMPFATKDWPKEKKSNQGQGAMEYSAVLPHVFSMPDEGAEFLGDLAGGDYRGAVGTQSA